MTDQKNKQGSSDTGMKPSGAGQDPKSTPKKQGNLQDSDDTDEAVVRRGADIENPNTPGAEPRIELDDNPDETRRKIPNA